MRDHLQAVEPFIINYTADTAEIYWLDGATEKALAMLEPFRPGRTLELALVEASAGRYGEAAAALREMPTWNYPPGMLEAAATVLDSAPTKAAAPAALPRLGNMSFAYMHVGAPERVLEFYEDEIAGRYSDKRGRTIADSRSSSLDQKIRKSSGNCLGLQTTNLGVRSSNLFGRASIIKYLHLFLS